MISLILNIVADIKPGYISDTFFSFNQIVAIGLKKGFESLGHTINIVNVRDPDKDLVPKCDHIIVTSGWSMNRIKPNDIYKRRLRRSCSGLLTVYLDADYAQYDEWFDRVFTVVRPLPNSSSKYIYAGWGADPDLFYIQPGPKKIFVDSYLTTSSGKFLEEEFSKAFKLANIPLIQPIRYYSDGRVPWSAMRSFMLQCSFFCCTQGKGESGLNKIEACYCGMPLLIHKDFYNPRTESSLECFLWSDPEDLAQYLRDFPADPERRESIRAKALRHTWVKSAKRILEGLNADEL